MISFVKYLHGPKHAILRKTVIFLILILPIFSFAQKVDTRETVQKFSATMQIIDYFYVDSVDQPAIVEKAIVEMLKELDPHSVYISKEEVQKANEPLVGNFEGIGVEFQIFKDTILVIAPVVGGPSDKVGIIAGDKIVRIDNEKSTGPDIDTKFVFDHLRGDKGTEVNVTVFRKNRKDLMDFVIIRDKIPLNSINASFMVSPEVGYIKLNRFSKTTLDEFDDAIVSLREQGMEELVLDLRYNTGGYLNIAIGLADQFIDSDKLLVYTEGLKSPQTNFNAKTKGLFEKGQLVILINEGSASASEIVSGAVQDWDRGIIVGRRSFGKGLVQKPFRLPDESVIRLTTAKYYTPSGRCSQKPYDNGTDEYFRDFSKRIEAGELISADSIIFPDSLKYFTDGKRVVYGGGGIMPDVFIPYDSTQYSDYYVDLRRNNMFNNFVLQYMDDNRKQLQKNYSSISGFKKNFVVDEDLLSEFIEYAVNEGVDKDEEGLEDSLIEIKYVIKALIARNLYDFNAYFEIISEIDEVLIRAVEILEEDILFDKLSIHD